MSGLMPAFAHNPTMGQEVEALRNKIADAHFAYITEEESLQKLKLSNQLEKYIYEYLCVVPHKQKFKAPAFIEIINRSISSEHCNVHNAKIAFNRIEKYASNLIAQPWRVEYRSIKMFGGFYKHSIARTIPSAHVIFTLMGYKRSRQDDTLCLTGPVDPDKLSRVSLDCFVACMELQIMIDIAQPLKCELPSFWHNILAIRKQQICNVQTAVQLLRCQPNLNISTMRTNEEKEDDSLIQFNDLETYYVSQSNYLPLPNDECLTPTVLPSSSNASTPCPQTIKHSSIITTNGTAAQDKSVRPKVRKAKQETEQKSCDPPTNLSWDYVYQALEKQGYSKDLGARGDLLNKKVSKAERLTKTLSAPNKRPDTSLRLPKLNDELRKSKDFSTLQVSKSHDVLAHKPTEEIVTKAKSDDQPKSVKWSCKFCTYLNTVEMEVCEMCSRSKDRGSESEPLVSGGRECPTCTLVNHKDAENCTACDTSLKHSPTYI